MAAYGGDAAYSAVTGACNAPDETSVVGQAGATIATQATPSATLGSPISDTATVTGAAGPGSPTGSVTFTLFGPDNATCTGAPIFTSGPQALAPGAPPTATASSAPFTPVTAGSYRWVAAYGGDAAYPAVTSPCNAPDETSVVGQAVATIATQATPSATPGSPISDTATVTGAAGAGSPTGTVTFRLFGPDDATCAGPPVFTSGGPPPLVPGAPGPPPTATAMSGPFVPAAPGTYRWTADYGGDANYGAVTSPCNAPDETSVVDQAVATIATQATPSVPIGNLISDTAIVTGAAGAGSPTGTVTFTLFGPDDALCAGAPVFTSGPQVLEPASPGPPPTATATSGPFVPAAPGTYRWTAAYSGDLAYSPTTSACNDVNETSLVTEATLATLATPSAFVGFGAPISDTATVTGTTGAASPTGDVTFLLFGPDDATCAGPATFTDVADLTPAAPGPPPTSAATSAPTLPSVPGTYRWTAAYSGDATYAPVSSACNEPGETSVVTQAVATMTTSATPTVTLGSPVSDTAAVSGAAAPAPAPTGTVAFVAYGPDDPTCSAPPAFTSGPQPLLGGPPPTAASGPFTPTVPGAYRWVAVYSGDAVYPQITSACNEPGETSVVAAPVATIATEATPVATLGGPISDTATVAGPPVPAPGPTGTVTFTAFGPDDATCSGPPAFTSGARPLGGGPPPTAASGDFIPTAPGLYRWVADYSGDDAYAPVTSACNSFGEDSFVTQAAPTLSTQALGPVTLGSAISDTATVTGVPSPGPAPTGTVSFTAYGPNDATCAGPVAFTSGPQPLAGGPPPTASSGDFTPTSSGLYRWTASYSGDASYGPAASACNAANETSQVTQASVAIATQATATVVLGGTVSDTATVTGAPAPAPPPTGTVTFTHFGPFNPTCTGAPIFTSSARPLGGGPPPTATSEDFTPTAAGTYFWVAVYSGDPNYPVTTSPCGAPNETSVVTPATPTLSTQATPSVTLGDPVTDMATVTGAPGPAAAPSGTVVFSLFGPDDPTCSGTPVFTSSTVPLGGGPPPTASSGQFTPSVAGTYNWTAAYSGDANYQAVTSPCGEPGESSVVNEPVVATIVTQATPSVTLGNPITDSATITGAPSPAPAPTGTVTFTLFGPADPTCTGTPIFSSGARPLAAAPPHTATSGDFTPTAVGTYNWVAVYSGDADYPVTTSPCGAPNETSVVTPATPTLSTQATPSVTLGDPVTDMATVTGVPGPAAAPSGTVVFSLFGPDDPTCSGTPVFTSSAVPLGGGPPPTASSGQFTPSVAGTYNWTAAYSGDANYQAVTSPCGEPGESSVVNEPVVATIVTQATPSVTLGNPITDSATITGAPSPAPAPTGTVTFTLFGPADPTCTGTPIFSSGARPLAAAPPHTASRATSRPRPSAPTTGWRSTAATPTTR